MNVTAFHNYVAKNLPVNSYPEVQAELRHEVLTSLDRFDHAHGDTPEARLEDLRHRGEVWQSRSDKVFWGSIGAGFALGPLLGAAVGLPGAIPVIAIGGAFAGGLASPIVASWMGEHGNRLTEAANTLQPYLKG